MKKYLCCFKGESSSQVVQEPPQPPQLPQPPEPSEPSDPSEGTDSSETINGEEDDDLDDEHPFGNNEFLNHAWRNNLDIPDDRYPPDSSSSPHPLSPPLLSHTGVAFRWYEILDGTQNLRDTNYLGRGNFGRVFRCDFPRIDKVGAVKIQDLQSPEAHREFVAEITTLHAANHPNVIKLLGKCIGREHRALVYEFMPKGSLQHLLYARMTGPGLQQEYQVLDWETRMRIAVGVAEALVYLHEGLKIIHRDVKVSNILLDEDRVPKLTDFGLATRIVEHNGDEQQSEINPIKGTPGYIAPETQESGLVSSKSDVYSYGVFLFALFTGRKAYERDDQTHVETKLTDWLVPVWSRAEYLPLVVDVALAKRFSLDGLVRLFQAARMCTDPHILQRPEMTIVELMVRQAAAHEIPECPPVTRRHSI